MSCVGTVHNVVPRPLLQIVLVTRCVQTLLCSCGGGWGESEGRYFLVFFFYLPQEGTVWPTCSSNARHCNNNKKKNPLLYILLRFLLITFGGKVFFSFLPGPPKCVVAKTTTVSQCPFFSSWVSIRTAQF